MKKTYAVFLVLESLVLSTSVLGQDSFESRIYKNFVDRDLDDWYGTLTDTDFQFNDIDAKYERAIALYGYIGLSIDFEQKARAKPQLKELDKLTDVLLETRENEPRFLALKGVTYGFEMIYQKYKMKSLGPKSFETLNLPTAFLSSAIFRPRSGCFIIFGLGDKIMN